MDKTHSTLLSVSQMLQLFSNGLLGGEKTKQNNKTPPHAREHNGYKNVSIQTSEIRRTYEQLTEIIQNGK